MVEIPLGLKPCDQGQEGQTQQRAPDEHEQPGEHFTVHSQRNNITVPHREQRLDGPVHSHRYRCEARPVLPCLLKVIHQRACNDDDHEDTDEESLEMYGISKKKITPANFA